MATRSGTPGPTSRARVYIASSLDGFIAGPDDDLSWLTGTEPGDRGPEPEGGWPAADPEAVTFEAFMADVGALLMGRRTYDVVRSFGPGSPYGEVPVLVATSRPLDDDPPPAFRRVDGSIEELVAEANRVARGKDVYLDGGSLIRQAADAGLIDDLIVTLAPIALGDGRPLFAGLEKRCPLEILSARRFAEGMLQLHLRPRSRAAPAASSNPDPS